MAKLPVKPSNKKKEEQASVRRMPFVDDANYYVMAVSTVRFDDNLIRFRNMAKSFKRK
ncbi:MAG: hypothetical protein IPM91_04495 [Bacteroidetes bacterium]|nr:hypothetical protein [Bacteroidota bacterium]